MHELKIIQDVFPIVESEGKKNNLKSISKVFLQVGVLRQIVPEFLQFAFKSAAKDTIAAAAELVIEQVPVTAQCRSCQKKFDVVDEFYVCPNCESSNLEILTGKEIILTNIEGAN